jgi:hypothetical protein
MYMALPNINQISQGMNVQAPTVPKAAQFAQGTPQNATGMPRRPVANMAPDNGQHGGAQRYMTPQSGAMNMSQQRNANPYGNTKSAYYGNTQPLPPVQGQFTPMAMPEQPAQAQQNASYRQALQQRMIGTRNNPVAMQPPMQMPVQTVPMPAMQMPAMQAPAMPAMQAPQAPRQQVSMTQQPPAYQPNTAQAPRQQVSMAQAREFDIAGLNQQNRVQLDQLNQQHSARLPQMFTNNGRNYV